MTPVVAMAAGAEVAFWLLAPVIVLGALGTVLARKPVHSAVCLAAVMISLAIQYAALDAPFLFVIQIIVYTGAILMLFVFVMMLVGVDSSDSTIETIKNQRWYVLVAGVGLFALLFLAIGNAVTGEPAGLAEANSIGNAEALAELIFHRYIFVFEAIAALLITAAVAAMVLAHGERLTKKKTQPELAAERMRRYSEQGVHPGPLPGSGTFARHNAIDTPALLADGTVAENSVSPTLRARGQVLEGERLADAHHDVHRAISASLSDDEEDEE
ncbi:NADH-quinone oxidoreductase subunit J [Parenemella sanctibonifatiensis]|uniref:NADH-quinone oxidoreductase subunit J n=1 Tax=Parenemella sanctibonifatiensis TaxID=2016505 RepID=A0A255E7J4_9ACTN|nr:NADH-quinone oxidoreductase subunit J [Parenemella sanctibonifatiensis]OYN87496.1 NADH:ubiquinone oxidoreductase subunit J [Parenemella sanctibonifatiensis]OYN88969.1 NADH:ubiquinone oxidoreductase subunit J [Parenemella sanctibonifatiensis]